MDKDDAMEKATSIAELKKFFKDFTAAEAPGRIEFLGNHLDYNGGRVVGTAIDAIVCALAKPLDNNKVRLFSETFEDAVIESTLERLDRKEGREFWANYPIGILKVLQMEGLAPPSGFELILTTDLPQSAGLSSSAAVELATALALLQLGNHNLKKDELARLCRKAENEFVGLPCGILDQGVSAHGEKDHLVIIDCSKEHFETVPMPKQTEFWIFDSGIKHDLVDSLYKTRHRECLDALDCLRKNHPELPFLAAATIPMLDSKQLPGKLKRRTRHVIEETARVDKAVKLLRSGGAPHEIGTLLFESHESSKALFENSMHELDFLVESLGTCHGVLGARLTGGGFGGAVMGWTTKQFSKSSAEKVADSYKEKFGYSPKVHNFKASDGARAIDPLKKPMD